MDFIYFGYEHRADIDADLQAQIQAARRLKKEWVADGNVPILR